MNATPAPNFWLTKRAGYGLIRNQCPTRKDRQCCCPPVIARGKVWKRCARWPPTLLNSRRRSVMLWMKRWRMTRRYPGNAHSVVQLRAPKSARRRASFVGPIKTLVPGGGVEPESFQPLDAACDGPAPWLIVFRRTPRASCTKAASYARCW